LTGSLVGQLIFGYLTDKFGRKRLYGVELIVVIFGTIGFVQCSAGYNNGSMSILGWIMFWRFFVGLGKCKKRENPPTLYTFTSNLLLGIGAEYPLSAVITAESVPYLP
jgi:MFS transporter, PHS family, inorganic phosphate transporter